MSASALLMMPGETGKGMGEAEQGRGESPARVQSQAKFPKVIL